MGRREKPLPLKFWHGDPRGLNPALFEGIIFGNFYFLLYTYISIYKKVITFESVFISYSISNVYYYNSLPGPSSSRKFRNSHKPIRKNTNGIELSALGSSDGLSI